MVNRVKIITSVTHSELASLIARSEEPLVFKGVALNWPLVAAGMQSSAHAVALLKKFYNGRPTGASIAAPEMKGRFFYDEDFTALNFSKSLVQIDDLLDDLLLHFADESPPGIYVASASLEGYFPGLREENNLDYFFSEECNKCNDVLESIWIGNATTASCHYDAPYNIACCAVGRRRFTLFPPTQTNNLYPGPLEPTPGGQAISLVDFAAPDFKKFPRFREALDHAQKVELEPGDIIYIPSMWWHHVEALSGLNVLVNFWWRKVPAFLGAPMNSLNMAILNLRYLPENEKRAWKALFDYYVFGDLSASVDHIPVPARGILGGINDLKARKHRMMLINNLNR